VIKAEELPTLMGLKRLALNWCFTLWIERGGRGNGHGIWCGTRGSGSMAGKAGAMRGGGERPMAAALPCYAAEG
jgi:hypothetical protein